MNTPSKLLFSSCSLNLALITIGAASVLSKMSRDEDKRITMVASSKNVTVMRTKMLDRIPPRQRMRVDQTVREIVGLSVAVILGFNIGDGNIRDRLEGIIYIIIKTVVRG